MGKYLISGMPRETFSMAECENFAKLDGIAELGNKDFAADVQQLYLMLNTLALLGDEDWRSIMRAALPQLGFVKFQKKLDVCYHTYVTGGYQTGEVDGTLDLDVYFTNKFVGPLSQKGLGVVCADIAQLTQFGKRFTYITAVDPDGPYDKFLRCNNECYSPYRRLPDVPLRYKSNHIWKDEPKYKEGKPFKTQTRRRPSNKLMHDLKERLTEMLPEPLWASQLKYGTLRVELRIPSSGSAYCESIGKTSKLRFHKWNSLLQAYGSFINCPSQQHVLHPDMMDVAFAREELDAKRFDLHHDSSYKPVMIDVPKSLTSRRLICPESVAHSYYSWLVRVLIEESLKLSGTYEYIAAEDQDTNRWLSAIGSATGEWATIDQSAASDRQSRWITIEALPEWLKPLVINAIDDSIKVRDDRVVLDCLSTMGNQITWLLLGIYTKAIGDLSCTWYNDEEHTYHTYAKGDDLIVPSVVYDTACDMLTIFGGEVNRDKSYAVGFFRESCGGNYVSGFDVTPKYWRRGAVDIRDYPDTMQYLCGLQHSFYGSPQVRFWLEDAVRKLDPSITYSPLGTECDDLWSGLLSVKESVTRPHKVRSVSRPSWQKALSAIRKDSIPEWYQRLMYYDFLKNGPLYLTEVDERLGVSSSRLDPADFVEPSSRWRLASPSYK